MDTMGLALLKMKTPNTAKLLPMIDQGNGSVLLKYGAQTLKLPPQTTETLDWYVPPETLNMTNSMA
jgi:hypothetical protein